MSHPHVPYLLLGSVLAGVLAAPAWADPKGDTLVVSRVQYVTDTARSESFPSIFSDPAVSGVQGNIFLDYLRAVPGAPIVASLPLTAKAVAQGQPITTSFSSKSEGALTLSVDGHSLTYMGYAAAAGREGVSNSETTNPSAQSAGASGPFYDRAVAVVKADGSVNVYPENFAYSGDNPRAVISVDGTQFYMAGNAGKDAGPAATIGARYGTAVGSPGSIELGIYQAADRPDESTKQHIKDSNFRGVGIFPNADGTKSNLYVSKGSGGNGDDGIFQVQNGTGDGLPTGTSNTIVQLLGDRATNPTTGAPSPLTPFGFFFANPTTLYVADEGNATIGADAGGNPILVSDPLSGLQKWVLVDKVWTLAYVLQDGLDFNVARHVPGYPVPTYTTGLRNMTGRVNRDGTVTIYAITAQTSAISGGEPDPTKLVAVTDEIEATHLPTGDETSQFDRFQTLRQARSGEVLRGVAFAPVP